MKKIVENEFFRGLLIIILGIDIAFIALSGDFAFLELGIGHRYFSKSLMTAMIVGAITIFALILRSAGHYKSNGEITPNIFDLIPLEIYLLVDCTVLTLAIGMATQTILSNYFEISVLLLCVIYLCSIYMIITIAVRCKNHTLITNTLIYKCLQWIVGICNKCLQAIVKMYRSTKNTITFYISNIPDSKKFYIAVLLIIVIDILFYEMCYPYDMEMFIIFQLIRIIAGSAFAFKYIIAYFKIRDGIRRIAQGDTEFSVDTSDMPPYMARQARELNNINTGVANAVSKQMKSEKLKTELITNVSHDIKTPLTSIINYIDLIQKENITQQPVKDYIDVLARQSNRLKKLIEDLVEASKASTGNITAHLEQTGLCLLLKQASGEYSEKARQAGLEINMNISEDEIYIISDGRLLWRIFDNLLNNACKYSQAGTRIYINVEKLTDKAVITFKNVSKSQLNISSDELMERFVRGDSSRNTEGSGLGLSIAQSLTDILHGKMSLHIDGDLFKVILVFDTI